MTATDTDVTTHAGVRMPPIIYGTAWKKERTQEFVTLALGAGFRGIDTAGQPKHYDEASVGAALAAHAGREDVYVQTKFTPPGGQDPTRLPYERNAPLEQQVEQSFATSLKNLQTTTVDTLLLHSPLPDPVETLRVWHAMQAIHSRGGVRQLGISNCYELDMLEWLCSEADVTPAVIQNRFYADSGYDHDIRAFCRERRIVYQSFWTLTANPQLLSAKPARDLAGRHGRTPAQVLFRFLTQEGVVPLTGTTSAEHMREDLAIFEFALTPDEQQSMRALLQT